MPSYSLNISIDPAGLKAIRAAGQKVTIAKPARDGHPVAWVLFDPLESNTITWDERYEVYANTTSQQGIATIETQPHKAASAGNSYSLENGMFSVGVPNLGPTQYGVRNRDSSSVIDGVAMITAGLYQSALVNGNNSAGPLNAVPVLFDEHATFEPTETIMIFLSNYGSTGTVLNTDGVEGNVLTVTYTSNPVANIKFNDATNSFQLV
ncbi:MAG: hypothetical protein DHS20C11_14630 [Lysobacteraceae bacterium]|nr:MAG: hypothetical protein DHS20C11_14630 [Xanthomonadaceae bacterium]